MKDFKLRILIGLLALFASSLSGNTFESARGIAEADLKASLAELASVRERITAEKIPLMRAVATVEDQVIQQKEALNRLRRARDNSDLGLNRLREQVSAMREQNTYAAGLLDEFARSFESRIDYSETQLYAEAAEEARLALDDPNLDQAGRFEKQLVVIGVALERMKQLVGGYTFEGQALEPAGGIETGTYAVYGPTVYFASNQSDLAGLTYDKLNASVAAIAVPGPQFSAGIRAFVEQGEGMIPADATLGKAIRIVQSNDTVLQHLAKGGSVGAVILALGLVCLLLVLFKAIEISRIQVPQPEMVQSVLAQLRSGDQAGAKAAADTDSSGLVRAGVDHANANRVVLEEILYERILAVRPRVERFLPFIALTAASAPLLGLLGTVTGMIKTFNLITIFGTGDAKSLSSGISEALVTTELGLIVAIPALILHGLLARRARQKLSDMEQTAVGFMNGVSTAEATAGS
ncbi:MAG: MotA/TolQ/ExbB proton channel family protein [Opitutales bacterium]